MTATASKSEAEFSRARKVSPGGVHTSLRNVPPHLAFVRAAGAYLWDADGHQYVDYHCAFGPIVLGHCHATVRDEVMRALSDLDLVGVGIIPPEVQLSEKIVEHVPSAEMVLLCNSGSEATYHALRVARAATGRLTILKFQGCYHGWHDSVLRNIISTPDQLGKIDAGSAGMMPEALEHTLVARFNDLEDVEVKLKQHPGQVAAIIVEPIPHNVGTLLPDPQFLSGLRRLADEHGALLIFDEVITGFRHALGGIQAITGVTPDLTALGKALANGYPIAALAGRRAIMERFNTRVGGDVFFAGTFNGGVVGSVAALATIRIMESEPVHDRLFALGERMRRGLGEIVERLGIPAIVTGFGSVYTVYFMEGPVRSFEDLLRNDGDRYVRYRRALIDRGVFEMPTNLKRACVSYAHTESDVDETLNIAEDALRVVAN
ncbi:MAG: aspartate aminotransferase family protein [Thermaerobacter sp.]|nr:aspartate aminotransferase family protein [Thermaerobacter sp.]